MARQASPSRGPSFNADDSASRRSSLSISNPNIFSDDYAVEPFDSFDSLSLPTSIHGSEEHLALPHDREVLDGSWNITRTAPGERHSHVNRPLSISKRPPPVEAAFPRRAISTSSRSDVDTRRTLSTSSRFSMPRPQSPYVGPSAPSQPYALYPQATRASSIASESTIRPPVERPFVSHGGPEHPYAMYQQNTVPEEDDDDHRSQQIPLGFHGMGQNFQPGSRAGTGNDVGDIVGSDGHIEQLPPYTRYADNVVAKGDMARIEAPAFDADEEPGATREPGLGEPPLSEGPINGATPTDGAAEEAARKDGWPTGKKKGRKTCCGLPLRTALLIGGIVFVAVCIGGVIGGVVGNERGTDHSAASAASTTTVWLDADPAQTGPSTPACPTGHYVVPLNQTQEISQCIVDSQYSDTWGCMDMSYVGISVSTTNSSAQVVFDDYSVRPQLFQYGPQPPDLNGTAFDLQPYKDKDDDSFGVGMFFSTLFDKLSILPANALPPKSNKHYVAKRDIDQRSSDSIGASLAVADKPWFCFWNSTIAEFWIFLDQDMNSSSQATATSTSGSVTTSPPVTAAPSTSTSSPSTSDPSSRAQPTAAGTTFAPSPASLYDSERTEEASSWATKFKRDFASLPSSPAYPKLIKMLEKRKPGQNIQPYCQQMQVLNDWQIMPIPGVPTICIEETEYPSAAAATATGSSKRWFRRRDEDDTTALLESNCVCEWLST